MKLKEFKQLYDEDSAPGWEAVDKQLNKVYPKVEPRFYGTVLHYNFGGEDPIDGTSIYDSKKQLFHRHFVTYGMSELYYNEEAVGGDFSKWGFEFTFRLVPFAADGDEDPMWAINMMNNLARYVYESGNWFEVNHFIPTNSPIRLDCDSDIVGIAFAEDAELGKIETPYGEVTFLQIVGITSKELERLQANPKKDEVAKLLDELRKDNPLLLTDLTRR